LQNHGDLSKWSIPQKTWILLIYDQYDSTSFNKVSRNHTRWWLTNPSEITWNHRFQPVSSTMLRTWNHPPRPISVLPLFRLKPTRDATVSTEKNCLVSYNGVPGTPVDSGKSHL
jgi:hypothetical protein